MIGDWAGWVYSILTMISAPALSPAHHLYAHPSHPTYHTSVLKPYFFCDSNSGLM